MSVNSKMTAIADEIRELSGTTGTMGLDAMANTLHTENTNFASNLTNQDNLIAQIQTALENKATPSGEDVSAETNAYTNKLATLETAITQLETELQGKAAGGGSGGGSVETCTLTIFGEAPVDPDSKLWYTDGSSAVKSIALPDFGDSISVTVSKNSIVVSTNGGQASTNATRFIFNNGAAGFFISDDAYISIM